jgi:hypothetical protein
MAPVGVHDGQNNKQITMSKSTLAKLTLSDMKRVGLTTEEVENTTRALLPLRDKTSYMCKDEEPDPLYEDLCGELCNVINSLTQLKQRYSETTNEMD